MFRAVGVVAHHVVNDRPAERVAAVVGLAEQHARAQEAHLEERQVRRYAWTTIASASRLRMIHKCMNVQSDFLPGGVTLPPLHPESKGVAL